MARRNNKPQGLNFKGTLTDDISENTEIATGISLWEYGAKIETSASLVSGERFTFAFDLPHQPDRIKAAVEVLSFRPGGEGYPGEAIVEFADADTQLKTLISNVVAERYALRMGLGAAEVVPQLTAKDHEPIKILFKEMSAGQHCEIEESEDQVPVSEMASSKYFRSLSKTFSQWAPNNGFRLRSRRIMKAGQYLALDFEFPRIPLGLSLACQVTMVHEDDLNGFHQFNVRFTTFSKDDALLIEKFISNYERKQIQEKSNLSAPALTPKLPAQTADLVDLPPPRLPALGSNSLKNTKPLPSLPKFGGG